MKKILMVSVLLFGFYAAGTALAVTQQGFVKISLQSDGLTGIMNARFNVATNPEAGHENSHFYTVTYEGNTSVAFVGRDAVSGLVFSCSVFASSPFFDMAVSMAQSTGYGTMIQVRRFGYMCTGLTKTQSSLAQ